MALQPRATLSAKGNGFITGKSLPQSLFRMPRLDLLDTGLLA